MASQKEDTTSLSVPSKDQRIYIEKSAFYVKKIKSFFKKMDTDNDDYVTYKEYVIDVTDRARRLITNKPEKKEEWSKMVTLFWNIYWGPLSTEKDGQPMVHISKVSEMKVNDEETRRLMAEVLEVMFHATDLNDDGHISVAELETVFGVWGMDPDNAHLAFRMMDTNKDGKINLHEFVAAGVSYFCDQDETDGQYFLGPLIE